jgi:hypothetical protein
MGTAPAAQPRSAGHAARPRGHGRGGAKQITDQFATLTALLERRAAPALLAPAYGAGTRCCQSAQRRRNCYLHAQALAPEMRWPYTWDISDSAIGPGDRRVRSAATEARASPRSSGLPRSIDQASSIWPKRASPKRWLRSRAAWLRCMAQAGIAGGRDYAGAATRFEQCSPPTPCVDRAYPLASPTRLARRRNRTHLRQQGKLQIGPPIR